MRIVATSLLWLGLVQAAFAQEGEAPPEGAPLAARVRAELGAEDGRAFVGQRVRLYIEVLVTGPFDGNPRFDLPQVSGALLAKMPGGPTPGSAELDGVSYLSQRHGFAVYAQRPGEIVIPPVVVRATARESYAPGPSVEHRIATDELRFTATMPPGAERLATLISAPSFAVEEAWDPQPGAARVGDAFTRTVAMRAPDVLGLAFPPLPIASREGLRVYPKEPEVEEKSFRGTLTGSSVQRFVYVCEAPGRYVLPALRIPWYDLGAGRLRFHELPAVTLDVAAAAPSATGDVGGEPVVVDRRGGWTWGWILGAGIVAVFAAWRGRAVRRVAAWWRGREVHAVNAVRRAARSGDAGRSLRALQDWFARFPLAGDRPATTLADQAAARGGDGLRDAVNGLQQAWVRGAAWDGSELLAALRRGRVMRRGIGAARRPGARPLLPPLNP